MTTRAIYKPKPEFVKRIKEILGKETKIFFDFCYKPLPITIRVNTIKIKTEELIKRLKKKWKVEQFKNFPEALIVKTKLSPGELGSCREHQLGYYYVQELASMMPPLALEPKENEIVLDCCASPGSKTTEIAALMRNKGLIIANDVHFDRIKALQSNLQRCGVANTIVTRDNAIALCSRFSRKKIFFDKILVDVPCSGEGTARKDLKIFKIWNLNMIKKFSNIQKSILFNALKCLKPNGILVYSTCTLAPEENESVIDFVLKKFDIKIEKVKLPLKTRSGILKFQDLEFSKQLKNVCRIYPQDNNTEGFFIAKIRKLK